MVKKVFLKIKHKKLLEEMDSIHIDRMAFLKYKFDVRDNREESDERLEKKLKRNFILSQKVNEYKVRYGNLNIYHTGNRITNIANNRGREIKLKVDEKLKNELNIVLGI